VAVLMVGEWPLAPGGLRGVCEARVVHASARGIHCSRLLRLNGYPYAELCSFETGVPVFDIALAEAEAIALKNGFQDVGQGLLRRNAVRQTGH